MAHLICGETGERIALGARLTVGRVAGCGLCLPDRRVSSLHAYLWWSGGSWHVRDLGSRNGTWVDGARLANGVELPLSPQAALRFGAADAPSWSLDGDPAPRATATEVQTGQVVEAQGDLLSLPPDSPSAMAYPDARGAWVLEQNGQTVPVEDGQVVVLEASTWRLSLPISDGQTTEVQTGLSLVHSLLHFSISRDSEHVSVEVISPTATASLERREHWWLIYVLARERLIDTAVPAHDQGWLDSETLIRKSGIDGQNLNVLIYRARRHLASAGVEQAALLVEVRRGQRRLGLPPERIRVSGRAGEP